MKNNKMHTPDGFKDFLPQAYAMKLEIESRIRQVFHSYGFLHISSPTVEFQEVFSDRDSASVKQTYKFFDRKGDALILRPDMTPSIARIAATHYTQQDIPLRLCYIENAFRYNESYQGKAGEFTQAGIELIGINSCDASGEVIAIAINSLLSTGLKDFRIDIGQVGFLQGALEESGLDESDKSLITNFILHRNYVAVEEHLRNKSIPEGIRVLLSDLTLLTGDVGTVQSVKAYVKGKKALHALSDLEETYEILRSYGLSEYVLFDLSMLGHLDYYTGIIFRGYAYGTGFSVLDGGRYDNLITQYGQYFPSVGFSLKIDDLLSALQNQGVHHQLHAADTLAAYTCAGRETALAVCSQLRKQGINIENSFLGSDLGKNIAYAQRKNMGGILFFNDNTMVQIIDLKNNAEKSVKISELLNGGIV